MIEIKINNTKYFLDSPLSNMAEWQWCERQFGRAKSNKDPNYWNANISWLVISFRFKNPHHASMFALRWV
jgi:hypothetical protein